MGEIPRASRAGRAVRACGSQRRGAVWVTRRRALVALVCVAIVSLFGTPTATPAPPALLPPLAHAPLDSPLVVTGGFGEFRIGHFHAGLDFGTGRAASARPVLAPLDGCIERVRASGVGYGRSIYLRATDGRLLVFGHLDAFAPPLARYVAQQQDSSGQYEQDLWPEARPLRGEGRRAASRGSARAAPVGRTSTSRSAAATWRTNPLRAGLAIADARAPSLAVHSRSSRSMANRASRAALAPWTVTLAARARDAAGDRPGARDRRRARRRVERRRSDHAVVGARRVGGPVRRVPLRQRVVGDRHVAVRLRLRHRPRARREGC